MKLRLLLPGLAAVVALAACGTKPLTPPVAVPTFIASQPCTAATFSDEEAEWAPVDLIQTDRFRLRLPSGWECSRTIYAASFRLRLANNPHLLLTVEETAARPGETVAGLIAHQEEWLRKDAKLDVLTNLDGPIPQLETPKVKDTVKVWRLVRHSTDTGGNFSVTEVVAVIVRDQYGADPVNQPDAAPDGQPDGLWVISCQSVSDQQAVCEKLVGTVLAGLKPVYPGYNPAIPAGD